jgi:cyclophilin family peptidyl-prolyl cis-trans isomerase
VPSADKRARKKENARAAREQREAAEKRRKRTRSTITIGLVVAVFVGVVVLLSVVGGKDKKKTDETLAPGKTYIAKIATNFGDITATLDTKNAPIAAAHFVTLAHDGVFDGSRWSRVIKGFVVQGGAPGGDPTKDYGRSVVGELPKGAYKLGDLAAAKTDSDPSGTFDSQFFIVTGPQGEALPAEYADFGSVTSGMDVVRKIEALPTDANDEPTKTATIDKVTITISSSQAEGATTSSSSTVSPSVSTTTAAPPR